jgi:hypothetical protein
VTRLFILPSPGDYKPLVEFSESRPRDEQDNQQRASKRKIAVNLST